MSAYRGLNNRLSPAAPAIAPHIGERRHALRDTPLGEPSRSCIIRLIEGTYREMPGLSLSLYQASRLFGLRERTCRVVLEALVSDSRLRQSRDGQYRLP